MINKEWLELAKPEDWDQRKCVEQKRQWHKAVGSFLTLGELKVGLKE
jgi:hypothetical protein